jgi:signal transduction histidine kinase
MKINNIKLELNVNVAERSLIADPDQLEQAFLAISINAIEAMPGGGTLRVGVNSAENTDAFVIRFTDSGFGIREEDLPHIFEPFYTTKHDGKGTGLGLAVTYGIIERHGGTIQVISNTNTGTTFTITLPRDGQVQDTTDTVRATTTV